MSSSGGSSTVSVLSTDTPVTDSHMTSCHMIYSHMTDSHTTQPWWNAVYVSRASDPQSKEPGFESCAEGQVCSLYVASVCSAVWTSEYLAAADIYVRTVFIH